jgi:hypothetical protein
MSAQEELLGRLMLERARREGHRPMHKFIAFTSKEGPRHGGQKGRKNGETAAALREYSAMGMTLTQCAHALEMSVAGVHETAKRHGIKFGKGRVA